MWIFFNNGKHEELCMYRHRYENNGQEFTCKMSQYKGAQTGCVPSNNRLPIQSFENNMGDVRLAVNGNGVDDKFEEVVHCAELVLKTNREGSRKLANDVLRLLQTYASWQ